MCVTKIEAKNYKEARRENEEVRGRKVKVEMYYNLKNK